MTRINLSGNALTHIGVRDFNKITWPRLEVVDLRLNPNLDCKTLDNIPDGIVVYTDCIDDDYEVDPALVGDGTSQTQDENGYPGGDDENLYQMSETQYDMMQPYNEMSDVNSNSNNNEQMTVQRQENTSTGFHGTHSSQSPSNNQLPSNSRVSDETNVQATVPSNRRIDGIYGNSDVSNGNQGEFQGNIGNAGVSDALSQKDNSGSSKTPRKPRKVIIKFQGVMKVLIP